MIKKIELHNFQKHKDLEIEFEDGLCLITGATDHGKSAIFRAFLWVCFNRFNPKILRHKEDNNVSDETWVKLYIDDHIITRYVSNSKNIYEMDGEVFKSFGRSGVPDPIADVLKMSSLNIQQQWDTPFMIGDSSGDIAKAFNALLGLDEMDAMSSKVNTDIRSTQDSIKNREDNLKDTLSINPIDLETLEAHLASTHTIYQEFEKSRQKFDLVDKTLDRFDSYNNMLLDDSIFISLDEIKKTISEFLSNRNKLGSVLVLIDKIIELENKTDSYMEYDPSSISSMIVEYKDKKDRLDKLSSCISKIERLIIEYKDAESELNKVDKELSTYSVCPLCGKDL